MLCVQVAAIVKQTSLPTIPSPHSVSGPFEQSNTKNDHLSGFCQVRHAEQPFSPGLVRHAHVFLITLLLHLLAIFYLAANGHPAVPVQRHQNATNRLDCGKIAAHQHAQADVAIRLFSGWAVTRGMAQLPLVHFLGTDALYISEGWRNLVFLARR